MISWKTSLLTLDLIHANLHFYLKMESFVFSKENSLTHKSRKCNWSNELDLLQRQKLSAEKIPEENHSNLCEASVRASQTWWWWEYQQPLASNPHPFLLSYKTGSWKQSWNREKEGRKERKKKKVQQRECGVGADRDKVSSSNMNSHFPLVITFVVKVYL